MKSLRALPFPLLLCLLAFVVATFADEIAFPLQAKVVDVTLEPYFAKGDGKTDDTEVLQKALDDHPNGNYIIYLPKGTYLVSRTLTWPKGSDTAQNYRRTILQGQDFEKTVIRLVPRAVGFNNPDVPKAVIYTGLGPAPRYRNAIHDLTVKVGAGNAGAVGIRFNAAQQGTINNVRVVAEDGKGVAGIDMSFAPNIGPLFVKQIEVKGFDIGILTGSPYNGMTLEHIELSNQHKAGIFNQGQMVTIRALNSKSNVPGVWNVGSTAVLTLIDAKFDHTRVGERGPAIINEGGVLFARNIAVSGYSKSIQDDQGKGVTDLDIVEYTSRPATQLCMSPKLSLRLPILETPKVDWGATGNWVAISGDYGGSTTGADNSKQIQQAIDDGAEVIYFNPGGRYTITKDVVIRKNVRRIIGIESKIDGSGKFIFGDGVSPRVIIERFETFGAGIVHNSNRTLILKDMGIGSYESKEMGAGDLFLEDVTVTGPMQINLQDVWARQLHLDYDGGTQISNNGGNLWVLGLTTFRSQRVVHTHLGGQTEILGAHIIAGIRAKLHPMFTSDSSSLSIAGLRESAPNGFEYQTLIAENRPDQSPILLANTIPANEVGGRTIPLYVGYVPKGGFNQAPTVNAGKSQVMVLPHNAALTATVDDDGRGSGLCSLTVEWNKVGGEGRVAFSHQKNVNTWVSFAYPGDYAMQLMASDGKLSRADTTHIIAWDKKISTRDHNGDNVPSGRGADAIISQESPSVNFGKNPELPVVFNSGKSTKLYVRFDLTDLPGPISDAALQFKIKTRKDGQPTIWNIFGLLDKSDYGTGRSNNLWSEDSLTWNNAPGNTDVGGGFYDDAHNTGGGVDPAFTTYLGQVMLKEPFGYYVHDKHITDFLKKSPHKMATLILTSQPTYAEPDITAAKENMRADPPSLYINYIDPNRSVGGEVIPGGYRMSPVEIDPITVQASFTLLIANPQIVRVEVYNEQGKRVLLLSEKQMEGEKLTTFQFSGRTLETGTYKVLVTGEVFRGTQNFVLLN